MKVAQKADDLEDLRDPANLQQLFTIDAEVSQKRSDVALYIRQDQRMFEGVTTSESFFLPQQIGQQLLVEACSHLLQH